MDSKCRYFRKGSGSQMGSQATSTKQAMAISYLIAIAVLVHSGCTDSDDEKIGKAVTPVSEKALEYQVVTSFPDEVPEVDTHEDVFWKKPVTIKPRKIYAAYHRLGWQDCLLLFGEDGVRVEDQEAVGARFKVAGVAGSYVFLGLEDGFDSCSKQIARLRGKYPEVELRKIALQAFDKMRDSTGDDIDKEGRRAAGVVIRRKELGGTIGDEK